MDEALGIAGRLALLAGVSAAVLFILGIALKPVLPMGLPPGAAGRLLFAMLIAMSVGVGTLVVGIILERQRWSLLGLGVEGLRPVALLTSLGVGMLVSAAAATILLLTGAATLAPAPPGMGLVAYAREVTIPVLVIAARDELVFRGYLQGLVSDRWGRLAAIGCSATAFAFWRAGSPLPQPMPWVGALAFGVFLGAIRERTGGVVASTLASVGAVWVQLALLHTPAGDAAPGHAPFYQWSEGGSAWWGAGASGFMASATTAGTLVVVSFLVLRTRPRPRR